jgi:hypothetical protein
MEERRGLCRILVAKSEGKEPRGRPRCRWENNNKNCLQEVIWEGMVWIDVAQDSDRWGNFVNAAMNFRVP